MNEIPNLIGGPLCGTEVPPADDLGDDIVIDGIGTYHRLSVLPNWMTNPPATRAGSPTYLWEHAYHDIEPVGTA